MLIVNLETWAQFLNEFLKAFLAPSHAKGDILLRPSKFYLGTFDELIEVFNKIFAQLYLNELA